MKQIFQVHPLRAGLAEQEYSLSARSRAATQDRSCHDSFLPVFSLMVYL